MWTDPRTYVTGEMMTSAMFNTHIRDNFLGMLPIGSLLFRAGTYGTGVQTMMNMWMQCNGDPFARLSYSAFDTYLAGLDPARPFGAGDGSLTTNAPDFRGRVPVSTGGETNATALGDNDGLVTVANRRPQHRHTPHAHGSIHNLIDAAAGFGNAGSIESGGGGGMPGTANGGYPDVNAPLDAPAHLVAGVWWVKYRD